MDDSADEAASLDDEKPNSESFYNNILMLCCDLDDSDSEAMMAERLAEAKETVPPTVAKETLADKFPSGYVPLKVFTRDNCTTLLKKWVESVTAPSLPDIKRIINGAFIMLESSELNEIYNGMLVWCRLINMERSSSEFCEWHRAYRSVEEAILQRQSDKFGKIILELGEGIKCNDCKEDE